MRWRDCTSSIKPYGSTSWRGVSSPTAISSGSSTEDGVTGVTSNPSIFEKAIGHGTDYDDQLKTAETEGDRDPMLLYERLAIADIREAADQLRPVYDATEGRDGFVSLEVSPYLALDTKATIDEARRLWNESVAAT